MQAKFLSQKYIIVHFCCMNGSHHITKDGYYSTNCLEELCHCKIKLLKISFCWGYLAISTSKITLNNKLKKMALLE